MPFCKVYSSVGFLVYLLSCTIFGHNWIFTTFSSHIPSKPSPHEQSSPGFAKTCQPSSILLFFVYRYAYSGRAFCKWTTVGGFFATGFFHLAHFQIHPGCGSTAMLLSFCTAKRMKWMFPHFDYDE